MQIRKTPLMAQDAHEKQIVPAPVPPFNFPETPLVNEAHLLVSMDGALILREHAKINAVQMGRNTSAHQGRQTNAHNSASVRVQLLAAQLGGL